MGEKTMIGFFLKFVDPAWYGFRRRVTEQKEGIPLKDDIGWYYISLMHRGESLLYSDERGSTYVEIGFGENSFVCSSSIKEWDFSRSISKSEHDRILKRVVLYLEGSSGHCRVIP